MAIQERMTWQQVQNELPNSAGKVFTRRGWLFNQQCIYQVPEATYPTVTASAVALFGEEVTIGAYISHVDRGINGNDFTRVGWRVSPAVASARDWIMMDASDFGTLPPPPPAPKP
jgi:hypothetical protein